MYLFFATCLIATAASFDKPLSTDSSKIRIMPVARTPEAGTISIRIAVPKEGQIVSTPVNIQFRIDGYALGAGSSQFQRSQEIAETKMGQTVRVVIDNHPMFQVNQPAIEPFDEATWFYDMSYKFEVPFQLRNGMHTVRMFPARAFGEGLKGDGCFVSSYFYVGDERDNPKLDISGPYIIYNEPSSYMYLEEGKPVLFDFYVVNTELSPDGYKVKLTIDGSTNRMITAWQPYYIYGLSKGRHTVQIELLDEQGKLVAGEFNKIQQVITVH